MIPEKITFLPESDLYRAGVRTGTLIGVMPFRQATAKMARLRGVKWKRVAEDGAWSALMDAAPDYPTPLVQVDPTPGHPQTEFYIVSGDDFLITSRNGRATGRIGAAA